MSDGSDMFRTMFTTLFSVSTPVMSRLGFASVLSVRALDFLWRGVSLALVWPYNNASHNDGTDGRTASPSSCCFSPSAYSSLDPLLLHTAYRTKTVKTCLSPPTPEKALNFQEPGSYLVSTS